MEKTAGISVEVTTIAPVDMDPCSPVQVGMGVSMNITAGSWMIGAPIEIGARCLSVTPDVGGRITGTAGVNMGIRVGMTGIVVVIMGIVGMGRHPA